LQQISTALGMPVSYFFSGDAGQPDRSDFETEMMSFVGSAEGIALNRAFAKITQPNIRQKVLALVKAIASTPEQD
jgi:hypothetical protein